MRDKPDIWKQPEQCSANCECEYDTMQVRLACWEHCCKAYCKQCSFYIKGDVLADEELLAKD